VLGGQAHDFFIAKGAWATGEPSAGGMGGDRIPGLLTERRNNQAVWSLKVVTSHPTK